jgi:16S rRNA (cytidine(1402)-2'-O)-methyltransferase
LFKLAQALGVKINAKTYSLHDHNERERLEQLVEVAREHDLLVVSDAGMPTVSDPGFNLVRACAEAGVDVTIVPGPSAVLSALAVSGLPTDRFTFEGFMPRKDGERRTLFEELLRERRTMIFTAFLTRCRLPPKSLVPTAKLLCRVNSPRSSSTPNAALWLNLPTGPNLTRRASLLW